jgi:hypothetical protein
MGVGGVPPVQLDRRYRRADSGTILHYAVDFRPLRKGQRCDDSG